MFLICKLIAWCLLTQQQQEQQEQQKSKYVEQRRDVCKLM